MYLTSWFYSFSLSVNSFAKLFVSKCNSFFYYSIWFWNISSMLNLISEKSISSDGFILVRTGWIESIMFERPLWHMCWTDSIRFRQELPLDSSSCGMVRTIRNLMCLMCWKIFFIMNMFIMSMRRPPESSKPATSAKTRLVWSIYKNCGQKVCDY